MQKIGSPLAWLHRRVVALFPGLPHFLLQKLKIGRNVFFFVVVVVNKPARVNTN